MKRIRFFSILWVALASAVALGSCGGSNEITGASGNLDATSPPAPAGLDVSSQPEYHRLTWSASPAPDVIRYEVYQYLPDPSRDNSYAMIGEAAGNSFVLTPNQEAMDAHFRVRAVDTTGNRSALSSPYEASLGAISTGGGGDGDSHREGDPHKRLGE